MSHFPDPGDMAELFRRLAAREATAFGEVVMRLRDRLRPSVRRRLKQAPELAGNYDEDDAIQSAMSIFWKYLLKGTTAPPDGIDSFLRMARTIIGRRILARARGERAGKRIPAPGSPSDWTSGPFYWYVPDDVDLLPAGGPSSEDELIAKNITTWLLSLLGPALRGVAEERFVDGMSIADIAVKHGTSKRTIERLLTEIRVIWHDEMRRQEW